MSGFLVAFPGENAMELGSRPAPGTKMSFIITRCRAETAESIKEGGGNGGAATAKIDS